MAERVGRVRRYNPINRLGEIVPEGGGPSALFYLPCVTNPEPPPKANDTVTFEAPDPRKNKHGKIVQGNATSVTVTERSPEPPPRSVRMHENRERRSAERPRRGRGERHEGRRGDPRRSRPRQVETRRDEPPAAGETPGGQKVVEFRSERPRERRERSRRPARTQGRERPREQARAKKPLSARYPFRAPLELLNSREANPALVRDKYLAWPGGEQGWHFREKNKTFFLERVFLPLLENYYRHRIPWPAISARWEKVLSSYAADGYELCELSLSTASKLALHVNRLSVLPQAGLVLHHLWGYPLIPAQMVKGVAARYARLSGAEGERIRRLFGGANEMGSVIFFDALPRARPRKVVLEALNCHYPKYYRQTAAPTDDQEPELHSFLAVGEGVEFRFALASVRAGDAAQAGEFLRGALTEFGIGAKTSSGYGMFSAAGGELHDGR